MPEKSQTTTVAGCDAARVLATSYGALQQLNWNIKFAGDNVLVAFTPRSWNKYEEQITIQAADNQLTVTSKMIHGESFDMMGKNKKHIADFLASFETTKSRATDLNINEWDEKITLLKEETVRTAEQEVKEAVEADKVMNLSKGNLYVTYGLMAINVIVFVMMVASGINFFSPEPWHVLKWGGSLPALDLNGDWWRVFTSMFLHFGVIHLALNMYALYSVGVYLEPMLGKTRYLSAYLCSGVLAALLSIFWRKDEFIIGAGASGAIFGMYGVFLALLTTSVIPKQVRQTMLQSILIFVAYNVFYGFRKGSGIDNAAHLGGLISGMIIGYIYYLSFKNPSEKKTQTVTSLIALATILITFSFFRSQHADPIKIDYKTGGIMETGGEFAKNFQIFTELEQRALGPGGDTSYSGVEMAARFKDISVPAWSEAKALAEKMQTIAKSDSQKKQAAMLREYADLRIELTNLQIKALEENTGQYDNQIGEIVNKINKLLASPDEK